MQEVFKDGSLGIIKPYNEKILMELLEKTDVHHINIFKLESDYEKKAKIDLDYKTRTEMREEIRKIIKEEINKRDILKEYGRLKNGK